RRARTLGPRAPPALARHNAELVRPRPRRRRDAAPPSRVPGARREQPVLPLGVPRLAGLAHGRRLSRRRGLRAHAATRARGRGPRLSPLGPLRPLPGALSPPAGP